MYWKTVSTNDDMRRRENGMTRICIVCGKKIGVLNDGVNIKDNIDICARCHSRINIKYIVPMNKTNNHDELITQYQNALTCIEKADLSNSQKEVLKWYITEKKSKNEKRVQEQAQIEMEREEDRKKEQIYSSVENIKNNFMVTTGYDFEGYKIVEYKKVVSGSTVLGTGFLSEFSAGLSDIFGKASTTFAEKLEKARDASYNKLLANAAIIGANAIIGLDFDYIIFSSNMMGVVANGTAVVIEKIRF